MNRWKVRRAPEGVQREEDQAGHQDRGEAAVGDTRPVRRAHGRDPKVRRRRVLAPVLPAPRAGGPDPLRPPHRLAPELHHHLDQPVLRLVHSLAVQHPEEEQGHRVREPPHGLLDRARPGLRRPRPQRWGGERPAGVHPHQAPRPGHGPALQQRGGRRARRGPGRPGRLPRGRDPSPGNDVRADQLLHPSHRGLRGLRHEGQRGLRLLGALRPEHGVPGHDRGARGGPAPRRLAVQGPVPARPAAQGAERGLRKGLHPAPALHQHGQRHGRRHVRPVRRPGRLHRPPGLAAQRGRDPRPVPDADGGDGQLRRRPHHYDPGRGRGHRHRGVGAVRRGDGVRGAQGEEPARLEEADQDQKVLLQQRVLPGRHAGRVPEGDLGAGGKAVRPQRNVGRGHRRRLLGARGPDHLAQRGRVHRRVH